MPLLDDEIVRQLIAMKVAHAKPSGMLRYLTETVPGDTLGWAGCMKYFRRAFGLSIKQASPILGWRIGELDDSELDRFLMAEIYPS